MLIFNRPKTCYCYILREIFLLPVLSVVITLSAIAEDLVVHGLTLRGVTARVVEGDTVRVSKGKVEKLVSAATYRTDAVEIAFDDDSFKRSLTEEDVVKFCNDAAQVNDHRSVVVAVKELLGRGSPVAEDLLLRLTRLPVAQEVLPILMRAYGENPLIVAANCAKFPTTCLTASKAIVVEVRSLLEEHTSEYLRRRDRGMVEVLLPGLGVVSPSYASDIVSFFTALETLSTGTGDSIDQALTSISQYLRGESFLSKSGYVLFADAIHMLAVQRLSNDNAEAALDILANVSLQWRNDKTAELVVRALNKLSGSAVAPLSAARADFLYRLAEADSSVRRAYKEYLEYVLNYTLDQNQKGMFVSYFKEYQLINPDPSSKNDSYRLRLTELHLRDRNDEAAHREVAQMRTGLSIIDRIKLFCSGYYYRSNWVVMSFLAALLGGYLIFLREKSQRKLKSAQAQQELKQRMASSSESRRTPSSEYAAKQKEPTFRSMARMQEYQAPTDPRQIELMELLAKLGLEYGATAKEVKQAFRLIAKSVHPDMSQSGDAKATDDFIQITKAYERSLEILRELRGEGGSKEEE